VIVLHYFFNLGKNGLFSPRMNAEAHLYDHAASSRVFLAHLSGRAVTICQSVKTKNKFIRRDTTESCVEHERFQRFAPRMCLESAAVHTRSTQCTVPSSNRKIFHMKPQHGEYEFLLHHHLYLMCHHVISHRTLYLILRFNGDTIYTVLSVSGHFIYARCLL